LSHIVANYLAVKQSESDIFESELEKDSIKYEETFSNKEEPPEILNLDKTIEEFKNEKEYKFIYLVYAVNKKSKYFSPYNFKIVPFENINKHCFFTLSNEGMMSHIHNEVRFTPFARFEEEYKNYQKILQVNRYLINFYNL